MRRSVPTVIKAMMNDKDKKKLARVTEAFLRMKPIGVIIATYIRAGDVRTGSFELEVPSEAELARRKRLKEEN